MTAEEPVSIFKAKKPSRAHIAAEGYIAFAKQTYRSRNDDWGTFERFHLSRALSWKKASPSPKPTSTKGLHPLDPAAFWLSN